MNCFHQISLLIIIFYILVLTLQVHPYYAYRKDINDKNDKFEPEMNSIPNFDSDKLPNLVDLLHEIDMYKYIKGFIKLGVLETRHLFQLKQMDFQLMEYDWDGITEVEILRLKEKIHQLLSEAILLPEVEIVNLDERNKLKYGKVILHEGVQSFDYLLASFGSSPPIGRYPIRVAEDTFVYGCQNLNQNLSDQIFIVMRGNCTFLRKAMVAFQANAKALIIVNSEDKLESPSSGLGIDKSINDRDVSQLKGLSIIMTSNTSWAKFQMSSKYHQNAIASIIPLQCGTNGACLAVIEEERLMVSEISWGYLNILGKSYQFLTSNFGSILPTNVNLPCKLADPIDACSELTNSNLDGYAIVAFRGNCRFDEKALNIQKSGGLLMIVVDTELNPLQRIGGKLPVAGYVGIPSIIVTKASSEEIITFLSNEQNVNITLDKGIGYEVSDAWINIAHADYPEDFDELVLIMQTLIHTHILKKNHEIVEYLQLRLSSLTNSQLKEVDISITG